MAPVTWLASTLRDAFAPQALEIEADRTRHAGHTSAGRGHFRVLIVSESFRGKGLLARQRSVCAALGDTMTSRLHALALRTLTPQEWKR